MSEWGREGGTKRTQNWLGREKERGDGDKRECAEIIHIPALSLADQQQAALRPATSIPYPIFASLLPSLSLRREVPMVGMLLLPQCSLCAKGKDLKSIWPTKAGPCLAIGKLAFSLVRGTSRRRPLPFCSRGGGSQTSVQADSIQGNTALGTWKVWRVSGAITMTHWQVSQKLVYLPTPYQVLLRRYHPPCGCW